MNHDKDLRNPWLRLEAAVFEHKGVDICKSRQQLILREFTRKCRFKEKWTLN